MFSAEAPHKPDIAIANKPVCIHTTHGDIYVGNEFTVSANTPFCGFVRVTDNDGTFWFNMAELVWIGPS